MTLIPLYTWIYSFLVTLAVATSIVATKQFHGPFTFDGTLGLQKFHTNPTPRIGGIALIAGYFTAFIFLDAETQKIWATIGLCGMPAFMVGLAEDVTNRISCLNRFLATMLSGIAVVLATGYAITSTEIPFVDMILMGGAAAIIPVLFTAFAISGLANAVNIIDGFHGLASGATMLILICFAIVGWRVDDMLIVELSLLMLTVIAGFFLVNFPFGKLFLGDAGAYFLGYFIGVLAVMLPFRNPEISPWVSVLILSYPLTETLVSIRRKLVRAGHHPAAADRVHLHMLIYRSFGRRWANKIRSPRLRSALTSVFMWGFSAFSVLAVSISNLTMLSSAAFLSIEVLLYIVLYRRVALLRKRT